MTLRRTTAPCADQRLLVDDNGCNSADHAYLQVLFLPRLVGMLADVARPLQSAHTAGHSAFLKLS